MDNTGSKVTAAAQPRRFAGFPAVLSLILIVGTPLTTVMAVGTTLWQLDTADQLDDGELDHVVLSSLGELKLGKSTTRVALEDVALVWSALEHDGATYLGTGNDGRIYRLRGAKVAQVAETDSLVVSALAVGEGGALYAGTLPGGKVYRVDAPGKAGAKVKVFSELDGAEHIWALQYDSKRRVLFAATGPEGVVYSIGPSGRADIYYDADDDHALSLLLTKAGGDLLVGTSAKARLLKVSGPGRATALHDFDATEVKGIAQRGDGEIYVAVNKFPAPPKLFKTTSAKTKSKTRRPTRPKPGKGKIYRRGPDGSVELLLEYDDGHLTGVQALDDGLVYAGTGAKGRLVAVGDDRVTYTVADVDERQVLALALDGRDPLFVTGDAGAVYRLGRAAAGLAEYRTAPLDAGFVSRWGRMEWRGSGRLVVQTRSGNTEEPDQTWSDWSAALGRPGSVIKSPPARYLQGRVRWSKDPNATLRGLGVYHLPNNQRAVITKVDVDTPFRVVRPAVKAKAKAATNPARPKTSKIKRRGARPGVIKVRWTVDNPDADKVRYRLFYREESEPTWRPILPSDKVLTATSFDWNTSAVPAGHYRVKVEAVDELDNPAPRMARHEKLSPPIVIDNQPPRVEGIKAKARKITGKAVDAFSPIHRIEYSLDGMQWTPVYPGDSLFDARDESFSFDLPADLPAGSYTVAVRAVDRAQNSSTGRVVTTVR